MDLVGMLPVEAGAAGAGQPFKRLRIGSCRMPIGVIAKGFELDRRRRLTESAIGNRNLEMTYVV